MARSLKVLIITGIYPPQSGGPAIYAKLLFDHSGQHGVEYVVLPLSSVAHLPKFFGRFIYLLKIFKLGWKSDVLFALDPVSVGFPAAIASILLHKHLILRVAGDFAWEQAGVQKLSTESLDDFVKNSGNYGLKIRMYKTVQTTIARIADHIIVPSEYLKKIVRQWGISEKKISVVYNGFRPEPVLQTKEQLRKEFRWDGKTIVSVGRLVPWKGFEKLIEIVHELLPAHKDLKLYIIDDGPERPVLEKKIVGLDLQHHVYLLGRMPHAEVLKHLKAADVFVLNTGYEGLSHLLLETMSVGTPIVTTNVGGNPELIISGENGLLVEYNNKAELEKAISGLLNDDSLAARYAAMSLERVKEFGSANTIKNTSEVLEEVN